MARQNEKKNKTQELLMNKAHVRNLKPSQNLHIDTTMQQKKPELEKRRKIQSEK